MPTTTRAIIAWLAVATVVGLTTSIAPALATTQPAPAARTRLRTVYQAKIGPDETQHSPGLTENVSLWFAHNPCLTNIYICHQKSG